MLRFLRESKGMSRFLSLRTCSTTSDHRVLHHFVRFAQYAEKNKTLFQDAIRKQNTASTQSSTLNMVALQLKDEEGKFGWPSFAEIGKQSSEVLSDFYFHRYGSYDSIRYEHTLNCLKGFDDPQGDPPTPGSVGWLGTPGIGKSK